MLTNAQVLQRLWDTGHFHNPIVMQIEEVQETDLLKLTPSDKVVQAAMMSYEDFFESEYQSLAAKRGLTAAPHDGLLTSLSSELLEMPRCGEPDYLSPKLAAAAGTGSWPLPCQKEGIKVHIDKSNMPSSIRDT